MILKRKIEQQLSQWKGSALKEPLVLFGARQVGKTFAVKNFIKSNYRRLHEVNFWKNENFKSAFLENGKRLLDPRRILQRLELVLEESINPESDLILFDEVQDCPHAYEALKFFKEDLPGLDIIATGSYLQLLLNRDADFQRLPVGSTKELWLRPLQFAEFLLNANTNLYEQYCDLTCDGSQQIDELLHNKLTEYLRYYLFTGGLPEVVQYFLTEFADSPALAAQTTRTKQLDIVKQYKADLNKYAKHTEVPKIRKIFDSIPIQLNQYQDDNVGRFSFKDVAGKQGYRVLRSSFDYLSASGLMIKSFPISNPRHPLLAESEKETASKFKAYLFDTGLLQALLGVPYASIVAEDIGAYKGYLVENFVAQELYAGLGTDLFSYKNNKPSAAAEVEFLIPEGQEVVPVEVKSSYRFTQSKSLQVYIDKFKPIKAYKLTPHRSAQSRNGIVLPIYLAGRLVRQYEEGR